MQFGIWTPLPHTIRPEPEMDRAITLLKAGEHGAGGQDEAFQFACDVIRRADELGFDTTLIAQRYLGPDLDAWVLATALAPEQSALDADLDRVPEEIQKLIANRAGVDEAVMLLARTNEVLVSGRGLAYAAAVETALKLEETCLRPVRGLSYADLRHGPIAIVDPQLVSIVVAAQDGPMLEGLTELLGDLRSRGALTVGIGGDSGFAAAADVGVAGPDLPEMVAPIALVVAGQLVVESLAVALGLNPDAPRGLNKVTQTDA